MLWTREIERNELVYDGKDNIFLFVPLIKV